MPAVRYEDSGCGCNVIEGVTIFITYRHSGMGCFASVLRDTLYYICEVSIYLNATFGRYKFTLTLTFLLKGMKRKAIPLNLYVPLLVNSHERA